MWLASLATATAAGIPISTRKGRHQEAAADAEQAGDEAHRGPSAMQQRRVDRDLGDGR
jgi:hypothetical protein